MRRLTELRLGLRRQQGSGHEWAATSDPSVRSGTGGLRTAARRPRALLAGTASKWANSHPRWRRSSRTRPPGRLEGRRRRHPGARPWGTAAAEPDRRASRAGGWRPATGGLSEAGGRDPPSRPGRRPRPERRIRPGPGSWEGRDAGRDARPSRHPGARRRYRRPVEPAGAAERRGAGPVRPGGGQTPPARRAAAPRAGARRRIAGRAFSRAASRDGARAQREHLGEACVMMAEPAIYHRHWPSRGRGSVGRDAGHTASGVKPVDGRTGMLSRPFRVLRRDPNHVVRAARAPSIARPPARPRGIAGPARAAGHAVPRRPASAARSAR